MHAIKTSSQPALLVLEDGSVFHGISIGAEGKTVGEVVFNTAMTGYQEILTDPSYAYQMVTLTYPHIGNVGTNPEDQESDHVWVAGLIIRDLPPVHSNWRAQQSLSDYLKAHNVVAIAGIDTRRLTRILREKGALNGCIMAGEINEKEALTAAREFPGMKGLDLAKAVTTKKVYEWQKGTWHKKPLENHPYHVIAYDFGVKQNILRLLVDHGCRVTVVPAETKARDVLAMHPDGVFFSNGPGDPAACDYAVTAMQEIMSANMPLFGICLGHQLLSLACGAKTIKMKFGHHGANHPIQNLKTGSVLISSQNHGFVVEEKTLPKNLRPTYRSLFDGSLQGIEHIEKPAFAFQGHPEASPGPHELNELFAHFVAVMQKNK
jgi:carbamoyl-phosphate synthase small subunit